MDFPSGSSSKYSCRGFCNHRVHWGLRLTLRDSFHPGLSVTVLSTRYSHIFARWRMRRIGRFAIYRKLSTKVRTTSWAPHRLRRRWFTPFSVAALSMIRRISSSFSIIAGISALFFLRFQNFLKLGSCREVLLTKCHSR